MSKSTKKPLALAIGAAMATTLAAAPLSAAPVDNPFGMQKLSSGYMQLAGEGKCGGGGKCGGEMEKSSGEGKCGGEKEKKTSGEGKCGGEKEKKSSGEGKCGGGGKCGGSK